MASGVSDDGLITDLSLLEDVSESSILDILHRRYNEKQIYTYIGRVLISMNPFRFVESPEMTDYQGAFPHENPPHVYAVTDRAYSQLIERRVRQSVVITGESGAGKTEAARILMTYLSQVSGKSTDMETIKKRLMLSNAPLESFGNAKTSRNDNSSRFGKYLEIVFNKNGQPCGGKILTYMLEKSRVVKPGPGERNFHVFYQITRGMPVDMKERYKIRNASDYTILMVSGNLNKRDSKDDESNIKEDEADFMENFEALQKSGMTEVQIDALFSTLSAILWLGEVEFQAVKGHSDKSEIVSTEPLHTASELLSMPIEQLTAAFLQGSSAAGREVVKKPRKAGDASLARNSLCKALYTRLFDWLVDRMNTSIDPSFFSDEEDLECLGVLDIYGFEIFEENGYEQFCINYTNEKLQQVFIEKTLKDEQEEYTREGIDWEEVPFFDNKAVCKLIEGEGRTVPGIFDLLVSTCKAPKGTDMLFIEKANSAFGANEFYKIPKGKGIFGKPFFDVLHYAGSVRYNGVGFCEKNKDELTSDILEAGESSDMELLRELFPPGIAKSKRTKKSKLAGELYVQQVCSLTELLSIGDQHFIRCMKPNETKTPFGFEDERVRHQIQYLGLLENIKIRRAGYAYSHNYAVFFERYRFLSEKCFPPTGVSPEDAAGWICEASGIKEFGGWQMGKTKLFIKEPKAVFKLESVREAMLGVLANRIKSVLRTRTYKIFWANHQTVRAIQAVCRRHPLVKLIPVLKPARSLQGAWRSNQYQRYFLESRASSRLQSAWRLKEIAEFIEQDDASKLLQSFWRRYSVKSWLKRHKAARLLQGCFVGAVNRTMFKTWNTASKLQALFKTSIYTELMGNIRRKRTITAGYSGYTVRKWLEDYRRASLLNASWRKATLLDFWKTRELGNKIQSVWITKSRMEWYRVVSAATSVQNFLKVRLGITRVKEYGASRKIQAIWRGIYRNRRWKRYMAARAVESWWKCRTYSKMHSAYSAAVTLQRSWMATVFRDVPNSQKSSATLQKNWRYHARRVFFTKYNAATLIQTNYRAQVLSRMERQRRHAKRIAARWRERQQTVCVKQVLTCTYLRNTFKTSTMVKLYEEHQAARVIQGMYRGTVFRRWFPVYKAARRIQADIRMIRRCKNFEEFRINEYAARIQRWYCSHEVLIWYNEYRAARVLQTLYRSYKCRLLAKGIRALHPIQAQYRGRCMRTWYTQVKAATLMKRAWRGFTARVLLRSIKASIAIQRYWRRYDCELYWDEESAAEIIQACWHGYDDRRNIERWLVASYLQAQWRMTCWKGWYTRQVTIRALQTRYKAIRVRHRFARKSRVPKEGLKRCIDSQKYLVDYDPNSERTAQCFFQ